MTVTQGLAENKRDLRRGCPEAVCHRHHFTPSGLCAAMHRDDESVTSHEKPRPHIRAAAESCRAGPPMPQALHTPYCLIWNLQKLAGLLSCERLVFHARLPNNLNEWGFLCFCLFPASTLVEVEAKATSRSRDRVVFLTSLYRQVLCWGSRRGSFGMGRELSRQVVAWHA